MSHYFFFVKDMKRDSKIHDVTRRFRVNTKLFYPLNLSALTYLGITFQRDLANKCTREKALIKLHPFNYPTDVKRQSKVWTCRRFHICINVRMIKQQTCLQYICDPRINYQDIIQDTFLFIDTCFQKYINGQVSHIFFGDFTVYR